MTVPPEEVGVPVNVNGDDSDGNDEVGDDGDDDDDGDVAVEMLLDVEDTVRNELLVKGVGLFKWR